MAPPIRRSSWSGRSAYSRGTQIPGCMISATRTSACTGNAGLPSVDELATCGPYNRHQRELSLRSRALEQLVSSTSVGQRQALGHDRVDLVLTEQLDQRTEVVPVPI